LPRRRSAARSSSKYCVSSATEASQSSSYVYTYLVDGHEHAKSQYGKAVCTQNHARKRPIETGPREYPRKNRTRKPPTEPEGDKNHDPRQQSWEPCYELDQKRFDIQPGPNRSHILNHCATPFLSAERRICQLDGFAHLRNFCRMSSDWEVSFSFGIDPPRCFYLAQPEPTPPRSLNRVRLNGLCGRREQAGFASDKEARGKSPLDEAGGTQILFRRSLFFGRTLDRASVQ